MRSRKRSSAVPLAALLCALAVFPSRAQWPPWAGEEKSPPVYPEVFLDPAEAERIQESGWIVADARPAAAADRARPAGAVSLPPGVSLPESLPPAPGIVVVGAAADPTVAAHLFWRLEASGWTEVRVFRGGFSAWLGAGLPVERGEKPPRAGNGETAPAAGGAAADAERLAARFGDPETEVIDCRGDSLWRLGHVPHALPFDFLSLAGPDGDFPPGPEIREVFGRLGPRPSSPIRLDSEFLLYDEGSGREAALGYLLLRAAGIEDVRIFPGGWTEWAAADSFPEARIVTAEEIARLAEEDEERPPAERFLLIDARHTPDWRAGHVPGAINLPAHFPPDSLETLLRRAAPGIDRTRAFAVFTCYGPGCVRSRNGATRAARAGFRRVGWHRGGWEEWIAQARPVERER